MYPGYLACARCSSTGALVLPEPASTASSGSKPLSTPQTERCPNCSGAGKVRFHISYFSYYSTLRDKSADNKVTEKRKFDNWTYSSAV
jgi:hypothetical protein